MLPKLLSLEKTFSPSSLVQINNALLDQHQVELWIKRDDLLHPVISWPSITHLTGIPFFKVNVSGCHP